MYSLEILYTCVWGIWLLTSQTTLQNKRFYLGGCMYEYSGVIQQFCGETETKFCTTHSNICISLAICRFSDDCHSIIGRNRFKFLKTTYHNTNAVDRTRKWISYMKYICNSRPKPLRTVINFGSFTQRNAPDHWSDDPFADHSDQWSDESLSRVDSIDHWSEKGFARKERHRSEILIRILPKERTLGNVSKTQKIKFSCQVSQHFWRPL